MSKKDCEYCENGNMPVFFVFADGDVADVISANYCPMCGRLLEDLCDD